MLRGVGDPWPCNLLAREERLKALPGVTAPLTPPVQPLPQEGHRLRKEGVEGSEESLQRHAAVGTTPLRDVRHGPTELLARRPTFHDWLSLTTSLPPKGKSEEVKARAWLDATE